MTDTGSGFGKTDSVPPATVPAQLWSVSSIFKDYEIFLQPVLQDRLFSLGPAQQTYIVSGGGTEPFFHRYADSRHWSLGRDTSHG